MKNTTVVVGWFWICLACVTGQVRAADAEKLRRLLPAPAHILHDEMALSMGMGSVPTRGYGLYHYGVEWALGLSGPVAQMQARLRRDPDDAQATFDLGELLNAEGARGPAQASYARSVTLFERQAAAQPDNPWLWTRLGVALERAGRDVDAETALRRAVASPPAPWQAWLQSAPDWTLPDAASGQPVSLSREARHRPVVFSFWATWCGPCRMELPHIERIAQKYAGRADVYGVNSSDAPPAIEAFARENNLTFPMLSDLKRDAATRYGTEAIPMLVVVDTHDKIRAVSVGYDPSGDLEASLSKILDTLLAQH